jgi:hypothetical protein
VLSAATARAGNISAGAACLAEGAPPTHCGSPNSTPPIRTFVAGPRHPFATRSSDDRSHPTTRGAMRRTA